MLPIKRPIGFTTKNEATFVFSPPQIHLHLHLSMLLTRNVCKKNNTSHPSAQRTDKQFPQGNHRGEVSLLTVLREVGTLLKINT